MGGGVSGGDRQARDVLVGGRAAAATHARPAPRMAHGQGPDRWNQLWESPLANRVLFVLSRISSAATCYVHTRQPTPDSRFLQGANKTSVSIVSGSAQCALSIVKWVRRRAPRVPAVRPARIVPERHRAGRAAFIGPRRAASPSPGPFYATLIVPEPPVRRWKLR